MDISAENLMLDGRDNWESTPSLALTGAPGVNLHFLPFGYFIPRKLPEPIVFPLPRMDAQEGFILDIPMFRRVMDGAVLTTNASNQRFVWRDGAFRRIRPRSGRNPGYKKAAYERRYERGGR